MIIESSGRWPATFSISGPRLLRRTTLPSAKGDAKEMINYLELPIGDRAPEVFRAVIEIPKDGDAKV